MPRQSISHLPKQHERAPRWLKTQTVNPPGGGWLSPGGSEHSRLVLSVQGTSTHPTGLRNSFPGLSHPPASYVPCANVVGGRMGGARLRLQGSERPWMGWTSLMLGVKRLFLLSPSQQVPKMVKPLGAAGAAAPAEAISCAVGVGVRPRVSAADG